MRWTLKLELNTDDGKTQVSEIGSILRSSSDLQPEEVGLTLEEGRLLLREIECRLIADQVHAYTMSSCDSASWTPVGVRNANRPPLPRHTPIDQNHQSTTSSQ